MSAVSITTLRGQWTTRAGGMQVLVVGHPSALLRIDRSEFDAAFAAWIDDLRHAARFGDAGVFAATSSEQRASG